MPDLPLRDGAAKTGIDRRRKVEDEPIGHPADFAEIVGNQHRALIDQAAAPARICRAGGAHAAARRIVDGNRRAVKLQTLAQVAGSTMVKRAPVGLPSPSIRFSAKMRPPWASTIWREIERPRPEWVPNFSPSGRSE